MSTVTTIKRGGLTAAIDSMGAQLTSLALNGNEYLWQGDPAFWGKHAPILFPIVGSLRNNTATSAAGTCEMPRHGLARIVEHKLVEVSVRPPRLMVVTVDMILPPIVNNGVEGYCPTLGGGVERQVQLLSNSVKVKPALRRAIDRIGRL